ncbi:MAG: hypothetical protein M3Q32_04295 [Pseudomonadota bacterium]|nr:hypothetical protein [Burkholderiales bacterium]MDQ3195595.1 hypothetical protein [Pseudomonadota bacterium]
MRLVYRNNQSNPVPGASLPKAIKLAATYTCQAAILVFAVIGVFYLAEARMTHDSSAAVAVVEEKPAAIGPAIEFPYFPDQFVNQGTLPDEPVAQF